VELNLPAEDTPRVIRLQRVELTLRLYHCHTVTKTGDRGMVEVAECRALRLGQSERLPQLRLVSANGHLRQRRHRRKPERGRQDAGNLVGLPVDVDRAADN